MPQYHHSLITQREDYEFLFRALSVDNVLDVLVAVLLEKKVVLFSPHRALLAHVANAIVNLLYPFWWPHVFIPVPSLKEP
jgi:hypothetical protein